MYQQWLSSLYELQTSCMPALTIILTCPQTVKGTCSYILSYMNIQLKHHFQAVLVIVCLIVASPGWNSLNVAPVAPPTGQVLKVFA